MLKSEDFREKGGSGWERNCHRHDLRQVNFRIFNRSGIQNLSKCRKAKAIKRAIKKAKHEI